MTKRQSSFWKFVSFCWKIQNYVDSNSQELKILLLGMEGVGKTEIGYILTGKKRTRYEKTINMQLFEAKLQNCLLSITEIGGSRKIQKIWHHYYSKTMGLIFCYDMSINIRKLQSTFQLFNKIVSHQFMRGKVILLVGTKSDLANNAIQLYDIENQFSLENLANRNLVNIKTIHFNPNELQHLWMGMEWLVANIVRNYNILKIRIEFDSKIEKALKKQQKRKTFKINGRRPKTAPASISSTEVTCKPFILSSNIYQTANLFKV